MRIYKAKPCRECGEVFTPNAPCNLYCSEECANTASARVNREKSERFRAKNGSMIGVGKGNAQGRGELHHTYKNGIKGFQQRKLDSMVEHRCERCDKDLTEYIKTNKYMWCVHHKDHDRSNNALENHELLCKRCHQLEHDCQENLYKV